MFDDYNRRLEVEASANVFFHTQSSFPRAVFVKLRLSMHGTFYKDCA